MDVDLVLAPVDASHRAERSVEYAVGIAEQYDASLHLLYVLDETLVQRIEDGSVDKDAVAEDQRTFTDSIAELFDASGDRTLDHSTAAGFSPSRLRQSPGSVILDVAEAIDADFIVVPREPGDDEPEQAIGRAALYVCQYASQPVLSV